MINNEGRIMKKQTITIIKVLTFGLALMLTACGENFVGSTELKVASKSQEVSESVKAAEASMAEVEVKLASIDLDSLENISEDIDDLTDGSNLFNVKGKLKDVKSLLDSVLVPVIGDLTIAGTDLDDLKNEILTHIETLDPSILGDANTIAQLEGLVEKINNMQSDLGDSAQGLLGQLDFVDQMLDRVLDTIVAAVGSWNPIIGMIIKPILNPIKDMIADGIKKPLTKLIDNAFGAIGGVVLEI